MTVKCVTLDLDDTLWDCGPVIVGAEQAFYEWLGDKFPEITERYDLMALVSHRREYFEQLPSAPHDLTHMRKRWLEHLGQQWGYGDGLVEEGFEIFIAARNKVELYRDVPQVLESLSRSYRLGAITNGNADVYRIGIGHWFHFVVTSAEAGVMKPEPAIFLAALSQAQAPAQEVVHVGDDPVRDIHGASAVGIRTVWVNEDGSRWPGGPEPDAEIRTIRELNDVLSGWAS